MASLDEYKKFVHSMPEAEREFRTLELFHPDFSVLRIFQDFTDKDFTLESTAPRDPNMSVLFTAFPIEINEPGENGDIEQVLSVSMGAVGNEVNDRVALITEANSLVPIEAIYRKYFSGDLSSPVLILSLSVSDLSFKGYSNVTFTCEDTNFAAKRVGRLYTIEQFPTLKDIQ